MRVILLKSFQHVQLYIIPRILHVLMSFTVSCTINSTRQVSQIFLVYLVVKIRKFPVLYLMLNLIFNPFMYDFKIISDHFPSLCIKGLTLPARCILESCIKTKNYINFLFPYTSLWCLKRFYEGL